MKSVKSPLIAIAILALSLSSAAAEELEMGKFDFQYYSKLTNQMEKGLFRVYYDDGADGFVLLHAIPSGTVRMRLTPADIGKYRANLEKYIEWEKLAVANQVELKKPLPDSAITCPVEWDEKGTKRSAPALGIAFDFLSRTKMLHLLQVSEKPVKSSDGAATLSLDIMYLDKPAAFAFLEVISEKNVAAKRQAREKQKAVDKLFQ